MKILIEGGKIWTGVGGKQAQESDLLLDNGKILEIFTKNRKRCVPHSDRIIDATGKFLMPGLINAHCHIMLAGTPDPLNTLLNDGPHGMLIRGVMAAKQYLEGGITTLRDCGAGTKENIDGALKRAINEGSVPGPRMLIARRALCMTGGHGKSVSMEVDSPDEARYGARLQIKEGADIVKIMATGGIMSPGTDPGAPELTYEEMRAAIEVAKRAGRRTAGHAQGTKGIKDAIRAGIDTIEHGILLDDEAIEMMLKHNVYYTPTLSAIHFILLGGTESGIPTFIVEKAKRFFDIHQANFQKAYKAGVRIMVGGDQGTCLNPHGSLIQEFRLLLRNGMKPAETLSAATRVASEGLGMETLVGTLEPKKNADILALLDDPIRDITNLQKIAWVMKDGRIVAGHA